MHLSAILTGSLHDENEVVQMRVYVEGQGGGLGTLNGRKYQTPILYRNLYKIIMYGVEGGH